MDVDKAKTIKKKKLIKFLKNKLQLKYKVYRVVPKLGNSTRSLYIRMLFAKKLLDTMGQGLRILNID